MWTGEGECQQISDQLSGAVRFAGIPRVTKEGVVGGFWLKHRIESPRFTRVEYLPPTITSIQFRITSEKDLDGEVLASLREAYKVGQQEE